ncbi:MAG: hypothetical protein N4A43_02350 [Alphaproteobacteria bacterium]|jgi:hypothetical protein|nr:hypothetical protein [Alphaproteobacteria bacterium]
MKQVMTPEGIKSITDEEYENIKIERRAQAEANKNYKVRRRDKILKDYPIHTQLEAITENEMGKPEKLNLLISGINQIKSDIPKEETSTT